MKTVVAHSYLERDAAWTSQQTRVKGRTKTLLIEVLAFTVTLLIYKNGDRLNVFDVQIVVCDSDHDQLEGDLRDRHLRSTRHDYGLRGPRAFLAFHSASHCL